MIVFLKGILSFKSPSWIEVDINGIGFGAAIPISTYDRLPETGSAVHLPTYLHVREDTLSLYAFHAVSEKEMFILLLSVSGIGPKTALAALSSLDEKEIHHAIVTEDVKRLSSVSGIGKKTAERIILDLKDKIQKRIRQGSGGSLSSKDTDPAVQMMEDATSALMALGYDYSESRRTIQQLLESKQQHPWTVENLIRNALNGLMRK